MSDPDGSLQAMYNTYDHDAQMTEWAEEDLAHFSKEMPFWENRLRKFRHDVDWKRISLHFVSLCIREIYNAKKTINDFATKKASEHTTKQEETKETKEE